MAYGQLPMNHNCVQVFSTLYNEKKGEKLNSAREHTVDKKVLLPFPLYIQLELTKNN